MPGTRVAEAPPRAALNALARAELVQVGMSHCLFDPETHAAALLNESALAIVRAARDGTTPTGPMEPHSDQLVAELEAAGFLDQSPTRTASPRRTQAALAPQLARDIWTGRYGMHGPVANHGACYALSCEDPALAALLEAALVPLACHEADNACVRGWIHVAGMEADLAVWRDGVRIAGALARSDARRIAMQALLMALLPVERVATLLHAAAVGVGSRAALLAGPTGSGKSTLALALAWRGAAHLADDLVPLARDGRTITPFPTAASVKSGSWPVLAKRLPGLAQLPVHAVGARRVRYLDAAAGQSSSRHGECAAAALVFPTFTRGAATELEAITPEDALGRLLASGTEIVGAPRSIRPLVRLVETTPATVLRFGCVEDAAGIVEQWIGRA